MVKDFGNIYDVLNLILRSLVKKIKLKNEFSLVNRDIVLYM
jgi:hypothetical protein